jgi:hypothetical protein
MKQIEPTPPDPKTNPIPMDPCPYQLLLESEKAAVRRHNLRTLIEPFLLALIFLVGYYVLVSHMRERDLQAEIDQEKRDREAICRIHQHNFTHDFKCQVISARSAVIK